MGEVVLRYCPTCSFMPRAKRMAEMLDDKLKNSESTLDFKVVNEVEKGTMDVTIDGALVYAKRSTPDPVNPQPTPKEVSDLVSGILRAAGLKEGALTEDEQKEIVHLHEEQKAALQAMINEQKAK